MADEKGISREALETAKGCRQYAMCKIDYLGTGLCRSGEDNKFVAYFPQGRMALYAALAEGKIPLTGKAVEIAEGCTLCGKCDCQCYFVTGLRPGKVMKSLKELVHELPAPLIASPEDPLLNQLRSIVGERWAESDPAVTVTYSTDPCPLTDQRNPRYVIMPSSREEISALVRVLDASGVSWTIRGNGTNILGFALGDGAIIDLNRMKRIVFDERNWVARIEPGVTAYELQREAAVRGYRVHVAEGAAAVCASIMTSGILSLFSTAYGTCGNNVVDADFVARDGGTFSLNDKDAPNLFSFERKDQQCRFICTGAKIRLHPRTDDEKGVLVPFATLDKAVDFARECALRRIGLAIGLLGVEYVASFISPTLPIAKTVKETMRDRLMMEYFVVVIGDRFAIGSIEKMGIPHVDQELFRTLNLGLHSLSSAQWLDLLRELTNDEPFSYLNIQGFSDLAAAALAPSPEDLCSGMDPDLQPFFRELYHRPEMTDLVWLNMFRVTSSRIGREKHFFPILIYLPLEEELVGDLCREFRDIADRHGVTNEFGFITPVDQGKRCMFEYDFFVDPNDPDDRGAVRAAAGELERVIEEYTARTGTIRWLRYLLHQGFCRMENFLYA